MNFFNKIVLPIAVSMMFYIIHNYACVATLAKQEETSAKAISHEGELEINRLLSIKNGDKNFLYHLVESSSIAFDIKKILAPKIIDLMVSQGVDLDELLKKTYSHSSYLVNEIKKIKEMDKKGNMWAFIWDLLQSLNDRLTVNDFIINLLLNKELHRVLVEENLIPKDIASKNIKEFSEIPHGEQIIMHKIKQAIREDNLEVLEKLLNEDKKNIELADERGYTPFLQAVYTNKVPAVKLLKKKGANLNAVIIAADGKTVNAFQLATMLGQDRMLQLLASYGLGIYNPASKNEKDDDKKETIDENQQFALLISAIKNSPQEAEKFLNTKTVNMVDTDGKTPLIIASLKGNKELVKAILEMNEDIQQQDKNGNTALHWAVINGHYAIARMIIDGRDPKEIFITNKKGLSAYDLAKEDKRNKTDKDYRLLIIAFKFMNVRS